MTKPSNVIDFYSDTANMYGIEPCPKCGSEFRCMYNQRPNDIQCDGCGYSEEIEKGK
jgi:hypothetical protein